MLTVDDITLDTGTREVGRQGRIIELTPKERMRLNPDQENEVTFRISGFRIPLQGGTYIFQIGKPTEKMVCHRLQKRYNTKN